MVVNSMPLSENPAAAQREKVQRRLGGDIGRKRGALLSTPIEEMLMMWPRFFAACRG